MGRGAQRDAGRLAILAVALQLLAGAATAVPGVGDEAHNFALESLEGSEIELNDFRGKVLLVNFFGYS